LVWRVLKKLKIELPTIYLATPLPVYTQKKSESANGRETGTSMFITALFTISKL
jgi:hypothetical protein